jgi:hypothetical protein
MPTTGKDQLNIAIDAGKKEEFKEWAKTHGTSITALINQFIEDCLSGNTLYLTQPNLGIGSLDVEGKIREVLAEDDRLGKVNDLTQELGEVRSQIQELTDQMATLLGQPREVSPVPREDQLPITGVQNDDSIDATFVQKHLATTEVKDEPTPQQPSPPVVPRKTANADVAPLEHKTREEWGKMKAGELRKALTPRGISGRHEEGRVRRKDECIDLLMGWQAEHPL